MMRVEPAARLVRRGAVTEVAACREVQAQNRVTGLDGGEEYRLVGLSAGVGLRVDIVATE